MPILVGSSRKSFLGSLLAGPDGSPRPVLDREDANVALTTLAAVQGVWGVRVHEVRASMDALAGGRTLAGPPPGHVPAGQRPDGSVRADGPGDGAPDAGSVGGP